MQMHEDVRFALYMPVYVSDVRKESRRAFQHYDSDEVLRTLFVMYSRIHIISTNVFCCIDHCVGLLVVDFI